MKLFKKLLTLLVLCASSLLVVSCISVTGGSSSNTNTDLTVENVYKMAQSEGYDGTLDEFVAEFKGEKGADGVGIENAAFDSEAHLILYLTNGNVVNCGKIQINTANETVISIGENGNWYINGEDTGSRARGVDGTVWHTGALPPAVNSGSEGDLYFNTVTCDLYKKTDGSWVIISNLKGERGDDVIINEGDSYDVTVNASDSPEKYAASKAMLSAVSIESVFTGTSYTGLYQYASRGSGVIYRLDKEAGDAYIITNFHVVYDKSSNTADKISDDINLYLYGMEYSDYAIDATYVGGSLNYDIAVLKVTDSEILRSSIAREVDTADSDTVRILDTAIAIGNPAGDGLSVTLGSVSVESQYLEMTAPDGVTAVEYRVMRIDTPVNSGNSGGGLFDREGRLIGIVNAKEKESSLENMGYAIPSNLALSVANNIIRNCDGVDNVKLVKCVLGIQIQIIEAGAEYDSESGIIERRQVCGIAAVQPDSVAYGVLMAGDIITEIEIGSLSYPIDFYYDGSEALLNASPDDEIYVTVIRNGETLRQKIEITEANFIAVD